MAAASLAAAGCGGGQAARDALAARGLIDEAAPVTAAAAIDIAAPAARVWQLMVDVRAWPQWQPDIVATAIERPLEAGVPFTWDNGGPKIHSTVRQFVPLQAVCWTGRAVHLHAIHCWRMTPLPEGGVRISVRESMDGWLAARFVPAADLARGNERWLGDLKRAAEAAPRAQNEIFTPPKTARGMAGL